MSTLSKANLFDPKVAKEIFNAVKGHSTIARLNNQKPVPFVGEKIFVFTMDNEVDLVAENGAKSHGGVTVTPKKVVPVKIEYGARVSDEFMFAEEEEALDILESFIDGFGKKAARGLDILAMHAINPRSGEVSDLIGKNSFDTADDINIIEYDSTDLEGNLEDAVTAIGDYDVTGWAFSKEFASALGKIKVNGIKQYPDFALGGNPQSFNGTASDVNSTVSVNDEDTETEDKVIVGDFQNAFKWGVAKNLGYEVIEYGDPDNTGADLKGHNQVYLRSEMYIGWAILDPTAFAIIQKDTSGE